MNRYVECILSAAFIAAFILVLIGINFFLIAFNEKIFKKKFQEYNVYEELADYDVDGVHGDVLDFFGDKKNLESGFFTEREKAHLQDVKALLRKSMLLFYFSLFGLVASIFLIFAVNKKKRKTFMKKITVLVEMGCGIVIVFVGILLLFSIANFSLSFNLFHVMLFDEGTYLFDPKHEKIVVLYPKQLFFDLFVLIALQLLFSSVILLFLSSCILKKYFGINFLLYLSKKFRRQIKK